jgi:HlyD family secretion protein
MEDEEIQSQVMQAQANLNRLQARLAELKAGNLPEEIAQARSRLTQAESSLTQLQTGSRTEEIGQAQAQLEAVQVKQELAQKRVKRYEYLVTQGAIAQDKLDEALSEEHQLEANVKQLQYHLTQLINGPRHQEIIKATAAVTEARYALQQLQNGTRPEMIAQAQAAVDEAYAQLQTVKARARDTVVRSPFAGLITQRYADPGAFVTPTTSASSSASATSTSIVALAAGLEILAEVPEADINQIQLGQKVEITSDAYPKQVFMGSVRLIAPEAVRNQNVTLFQVQVQIDTGKDKLRSGMNVELTFLGNQIPNATVVPSVAVLTQNGRVGVLVPDQNHKPKFKPVTVGVIVGNQTQIIQGVKIGDKVFIDYPEKSN